MRHYKPRSLELLRVLFVYCASNGAPANKVAPPSALSRSALAATMARASRSRFHPRGAHLVLDLIERVVVRGNTRVVDLFETNDNRVPHAGLIDGDDLAVVVEPVRFRAQNLNLRPFANRTPRAHIVSHSPSLANAPLPSRSVAVVRDTARASSR